MSYQVLARKWRPKTLNEVVGQPQVVKALNNALEQGRLHHAYLFTGTRGVGKTTIARALAKSLNCEQSVSPQPCGQCSACQEIDQGCFIDLIEVDAASRTKVEDTRDLLDNVQYAPSKGRFKIYLIDEVHMLSTHSFNALLKTLEEPPDHVKFLLATTDPQKLPVTVLSRCLQFGLKQIAPELLATHIAHILEQEQVAFEPAALKVIAEAARGSVRDALSLTDQAIAHGAGRLALDEVSAMLGIIDRDQIHKLLEALAEGSAMRVLERVGILMESGADLIQAAKALISALHRIALLQMVPQLAGDVEPYQLLAKRFAVEDVQIYYQIALLGHRDLSLAPNEREGFEMMLMRMLLLENAPQIQQATEKKTLKTAKTKSETESERRSETSASETGAEVGSEDIRDWSRAVEKLQVDAGAANLARNCILHACEQDQFVLHLPPVREAFKTAQAEKRLAEGLARLVGKPIRLIIKVQEPGQLTPAQSMEKITGEKQRTAANLIENDPVVIDLKQKLGATIQRDSIQSIETR